MNDMYFILVDGEQTGPYTFEELVEKEPDIHTRILAPAENRWQDACDLPELYEYFRELGVDFPTEDNLASFWLRLLAFLIDLVLLSVLLDFIFVILTSYGYISNLQAYNSIQSFNKMPAKDLLILQLILNATLIVYNSAFEASKFKGSPGKKICRIMVVDDDGMGITFLNAVARSLCKVISLSFWGIGFLSIFWTEHRQALHDYLAKTYVIKKDA